MTRLHADPVEVRTAATAEGPVPEAFTWRGRDYVVHEVLTRWTSSGVWWRGGAEQLDDGEVQWWRVEASTGRRLGAGPGTYELSFRWSTGWAVRRVVD